jgi:hypothetical protein
MKIPADAIIPPQKLTRYLLVFKEVDDKSKFLAQAGFDAADAHVLEAAIRKLIQTEEATYDLTNEFGDYYRVEGNLVGPSGQLAVVTIWIVKARSDDRFRFVTLKPKR